MPSEEKQSTVTAEAPSQESRSSRLKKVTAKEEKIKKRKKRGAAKTAAIVIIWIAVIIFAVWLTLYLSVKIAGFKDIPALLSYIQTQVNF